MVSEKGYILHSLLTLGFCDSQTNADSINFIQIRKNADHTLDIILVGYYNNNFKRCKKLNP